MSISFRFKEINTRRTVLWLFALGSSGIVSPAWGNEKGVLEEVLVSASYREQSAQDVAGGIQVFGGEQLDKKGVSGLQDYLQEVPSVSLQKSGVGKANIAIRGISNLNSLDIGYADGSPTTGVYFNDVAIQGSGVFPDLNIFDLQRIEVLKGPQGTLYGEGSMGGAIKMIMMPPNYQEVRVRTAITASQTEAASDPNWDMRAAFNVPLVEDTLALRMVASKRFDSGFVSYPALDQEDPDDERADSFRATLGWIVNDRLELEYLYLYDYNDRGQLPVVDDGQEENLINSRPENQYATTEFDVHSLTARLDLGFAGLTSVSSWFNTDRESQRRIPILQTLLDAQVGFSTAELFPSAYTHVVTQLKSFSQELRLVSKGDERLDWIVGAFYRDRDQKFDQEKYEEFAPNDPLGLLPLLLGPDFLALSGLQEAGFGGEPFEQIAVYGEVNYELLPQKLELTAGLRYFRDEVSFFQDTVLYGAEEVLFGTDPQNIDLETGEVTIFFGDGLVTEDLLHKLSLAWFVDDNKMLYATASKGFRSGTPNLFAALQSGPPIVRPDFVQSYEIGAKTSWLDGALVLNAAVYRIDWEDLQGLLIGTAKLGAVEGVPFAHLGNGGDAEVTGQELSAVYKATEGLTLTLALGHNEGEVTDPAAESNVSRGSELPNKPEWTWTAGLNYTWPLWRDLLGELAFSYTYVDEQLTVFQSEEVPEGIAIDDYYMSKLSLAVEGGQWRAQVFGENLEDDRIVISRSQPSPQSTMLRPRTLGVRLSYDF